MKIARLIDPQFHAALNKLTAGDLPLRTAFKLKGIVKTVNDEYAKYEEVRKAALQKYGKKKEDGSLDLTENQEVKFEGSSLKDFAMELTELAKEEIQLPTVSLSELVS